MFRRISSYTFIAMCCGIFFTSPQLINTVFADTLTQSAKIGDTSDEVVTIQQILNSDPDTQVASDGPGSKGQETSFFGAKTQQAVIKFQNKYQADILVPAGLSSGNGFVGPLTLKKMSEVMYANYGSSSNSSASSPIPSSTPASSALQSDSILKILANSGKIALFSLSELKTAPGRTLIATGLGFDTTQNTVHIGDNYTISNVPSTNSGMQISFTIPQNVSVGTYHVWITTGTASTQDSKLQTQIIVGTTAVSAPSVVSASPQNVSLKDTITLVGTGFTNNNGVYTTLGKITGLSSPDGKTLTFRVSDLPGLKNLKSNTMVTVGLAVGNENGPEIHPTTTFILNND